MRVDVECFHLLFFLAEKSMRTKSEPLAKDVTGVMLFNPCFNMPKCFFLIGVMRTSLDQQIPWTSAARATTESYGAQQRFAILGYVRMDRTVILDQTTLIFIYK